MNSRPCEESMCRIQTDQPCFLFVSFLYRWGIDGLLKGTSKVIWKQTSISPTYTVAAIHSFIYVWNQTPSPVKWAKMLTELLSCTICCMAHNGTALCTANCRHIFQDNFGWTGFCAFNFGSDKWNCSSAISYDLDFFFNSLNISPEKISRSLLLSVPIIRQWLCTCFLYGRLPWDHLFVCINHSQHSK